MESCRLTFATNRPRAIAALRRWGVMVLVLVGCLGVVLQQPALARSSTDRAGQARWEKVVGHTLIAVDPSGSAVGKDRLPERSSDMPHAAVFASVDELAAAGEARSRTWPGHLVSECARRGMRTSGRHPPHL